MNKGILKGCGIQKTMYYKTNCIPIHQQKQLEIKIFKIFDVTHSDIKNKVLRNKSINNGCDCYKKPIKLYYEKIKET